MPFPQQPLVTREPHIKALEIVLLKVVDPDPPEEEESVRFRITVHDQFDQHMTHFYGDLIPHAPPIIVTALQDIMDWAWTKAESEVIP